MTYQWQPRQHTLFASRLDLLARSLEAGPHVACVQGLQFSVRPSVFSPKFFESTDVLTSMIEFRRNEKFLEIGTGCGATAIIAALHGASDVVASDISKEAVLTAQNNAVQHGVSDRATILVADVFSGIPKNMQFDTIYWNFPWLFTRAEQQLSLFERTISDPGYGSLSRLFREAQDWLLPGGRILLGFGSFGDKDKLFELAMFNCWTMRATKNVSSSDNKNFEYTLFTFEPKKI